MNDRHNLDGPKDKAMRPLRAIILVSLVLLPGCQTQREVFEPKEQHDLRVAMVQMSNNVVIDNGVITQHTIYPYHFAANAAEPNDLGNRDLAILASHFRRYPGQIGVRKGTASEELYARRIEAVRKYMVAAGVDANRIVIDNALPGGAGRVSEEVVSILAAEREPDSGQGGRGRETSWGDPSEGDRHVGTE